MKNYYKNNNVKKLEYQKQYNEDNQVKILEYQSQYNKKNKDKISEKYKKYYEANKNKINEARRLKKVKTKYGKATEGGQHNVKTELIITNF